MQLSVNSNSATFKFLLVIETSTMAPLDVFIRNFGCSANTADSEVLAGCLSQAGFQFAASESQADVIIYNTCAVKGPTENRVIYVMKRAQKNKKIIVTGCLPKINFERLLREVNFDAAIGPSAGKEIVDIVNRVSKGEKITDVRDLDLLPSLDLPKIRKNPVISIVPINYGCLGSCSYCCVVHARGHLRSHSINEIVKRVQNDSAKGAKEFWLTSQDTACYGRDLKTNLAKLLSALDRLKGDFKIRVGMMTPNMITDIHEQLIESFKSDKIFKFLHLPMQSGDDETLMHMRRCYTAAKFKEIIEAFRAKFPELTLATDVIVGYPGESKEAFENTIKLLEEVKPDVINVSKFFARPKTAAAKINSGLVEKEEIKRRSTLVASLGKRISLEQNKRWIGWTGEVFIDEKGKVEDSWVGRNFAYKTIVVKDEEKLFGRTVKVEAVEACSTYLKGIKVKTIYLMQ